MNLKEKYTQPDLPTDHLDQLTAQLLTTKFDAEITHHYREVLSQKHGIDRPVERAGRIIKWPLLLGLAASFAVLLYGVSVFFQEAPSALQLAENYLEVPFPHTNDAKGQTTISELRNEATLAYETGDFQKSAELRTELLAQDEVTPEDQLYLGLSSLYQSPPELDVAIDQFQTIISSDLKKWRGEAQWFLALALIKANREEEAKSVLQTIVDTAAWNKNEARKLQNALK